MHLAQRCRDVSGSPETFAYDTIGRVISHGTPLGNFTLSYLGETSQSVSEQAGSIQGVSSIQGVTSSIQGVKHPPEQRGHIL